MAWKVFQRKIWMKDGDFLNRKHKRVRKRNNKMILMNMMMMNLQPQLPFSHSLFNLSKVISHQWLSQDCLQFQGHQECLQAYLH